MAMSVQEAYDILNKLHGYTGPETKKGIKEFINARDIPIAVKYRGGMIGMQEGGSTDDQMLKEIEDAQKELVKDVAVDPETVVKKADVTDLDADIEGTIIGEGKPRDYKKVDAIDAGFTPPPPGSATTSAFVTFHNPETGEVVTVPGGGYTPPAGFVKGQPKGKFTPSTPGIAKETVDKATTTTIADEDIEQADEPVATAPKQKLDAEGNPMVDEEGNPIYERDVVTKKSETKVTEELKDLDAKTLEKFETDEEGNLILDAEGKPIPRNQIEAVTKDTTDVSDIDAAKIGEGEGSQIDELTDETKRKLEEGEKIEGTGVDTTKVEETFGTGEVKAASVKDELATLMDEFDDGQTPAWAAGSMRKAMQTLAARGLGASSLAGQAVIQAAMEAALPIAQIDASNKQEMAILKAEQRAKFMQQDFDQAFEAKVKNAARISEIADINFTAEQQIALENAKLAQTTNLANLEAENAVILAEAAAVSALELENLSNQNKAKVENARNFLQIDLANLDNEQETALFKSQKQIDAILSDTASENAMLQFNAKSRQQSEEFDASLTATVKQFNAAQKNAISQFNAGEENAIEKFNTNQQNLRDQFNADQALVIAQANAKWRQDVETINNATENQANFDVAKETNNLTNKQIDEVWQRERDIMSFIFTQSENALDRVLKVLLSDKDLKLAREQIEKDGNSKKAELFARVFFGDEGLI
tara:strand:+ start:304 stop:2424 length:2121 start_codon:yes stop_codon:yes gene_type:complete